MLRYVIKRVGLAGLTVLIITAITFFAMNAIPGGPFAAEKAPSPAVKAVLEARFNLDKPVPEQYVLYLGNIIQGDFGISLKTGRDIILTISESFAVSAKLGGWLWLLPLVLVLCWAVWLRLRVINSRTGSSSSSPPCRQRYRVLFWLHCCFWCFPSSWAGSRYGVRVLQTISYL